MKKERESDGLEEMSVVGYLTKIYEYFFTRNYVIDV
jgi:hypothetical protein